MRAWLKKLYDSYRFFFYGFFGAAMVVAMLLAAEYVAVLFGKENQWDAMAFVGSLVGGALTLIGVQMTIRHMYHAEFNKDFPHKASALRYVRDSITGIRIVLQIYIETDAFKDELEGSLLDQEINGFFHDRENILDKAIAVSNEVNVITRLTMTRLGVLSSKISDERSTPEQRRETAEHTLERIKEFLGTLEECEEELLNQLSKAKRYL